MAEYSLEKFVDLQNPCGVEDHRAEQNGKLIEETLCKYLTECENNYRRFDVCTYKHAWELAKTVARGSSPLSEKQELDDQYRKNLYSGIKFLDNNSEEIILLTNDTIDSLVTNVMIKANNYLEKAKSLKNQ